MEIIYKPARRGKTFDIVTIAQDHRAYIVVPHRSQIAHIKSEYPGCPQIVTFDDLLTGRLLGTHKRIVIDNADACIQSLTMISIQSFHLSGHPEDELIQTAKKQGLYIVVPTMDDAGKTREKYPEIRFPVSFKEFMNSRDRNSPVQKIAFKDFDRSIAIAMSNYNLLAISVTNPVDAEIPNHS